MKEIDSKSKTLYISDLDGTLLNKNAELSQYAKDALNRKFLGEIYFSVATARTAASAFVILDGIRWNMPVILLNGVLIYDFSEKRYVQELPIPSQAVAAIAAVLRRLETTGLMYQMQNNEQLTYYETMEHKPTRDFIDERIVRYKKKFYKTTCFSDVPAEGIIYFTLIDTQDKLQTVYEELTKIPDISLSMYKDIYNVNLWYLEIHNDRASKQNATEFLKKTYGFERIIGFGDNLNDLPLFAACDVKVAVENANEEVKNAADFICDTNENDGVIKWIEKNA